MTTKTATERAEARMAEIRRKQEERERRELVQRQAAPAVPADVLRVIHRHYNLSQIQIEKLGAVLRGEL